MDLHLYPFGNTKLDKDSQTVTCQHGEAECDANGWEQCAVEQSSPRVYLEFIHCLEQKLPMGHADELFPTSWFLDCAAAADGLDEGKLQKCHDNPMLRWQLQEKYGKATPEHSNIPWVVVNGIRMDEEKEDLLTVVCRQYIAAGGTASACSSVITMEREWN
mmetsp:Transcript_21137/g.34025  ORF Transcript_21137/g.34025 Transcript_21137/m.34025 type:complete len:161 (-) Transcript_21137:44-526(-)